MNIDPTVTVLGVGVFLYSVRRLRPQWEAAFPINVAGGWMRHDKKNKHRATEGKSVLEAGGIVLLIMACHYGVVTFLCDTVGHFMSHYQWCCR